jgi:hypothetical protein
MLRRIKRDQENSLPSIPMTSRFDRMPVADLELALETSLLRTAELFRGFQHKEIETAWVVAQMTAEVKQAYGVLLALQRRVET